MMMQAAGPLNGYLGGARGGARSPGPGMAACFRGYHRLVPRYSRWPAPIGASQHATAWTVVPRAAFGHPGDDNGNENYR